MRPASSGGSRGTSGTPCRQNMGIDPSVAISRGEGAHRKWCRELWCFPRVRPVCQGTLAFPAPPPSRPRPSQPHPEQGRGQPFTVDVSPFYRRENRGPQSPVVAAGQVLAERGLGPDAALCPLPEDVLQGGWLTNLSSKPGGAPCRLPGWAMASCQAQNKGPTFSHGPGPSWDGSSR